MTAVNGMSNLTERLINKFGKYMRPDDDIDWNLVYENEAGELVCGVCGKNLTLDISSMKALKALYANKDMIRVECDCQRNIREEKQRKEEQEMLKELQEKENERKLEELRSYSAIGEKFKNVRFEDYKPENKSQQDALDFCRKWADNPEGGIYICGESGLGKSMLMACMANHIMYEKKQSVYFTNTFRLQRPMQLDEIIDRSIEADYLFFDDLGTSTFERYGEKTKIDDLLYYLIDERYLSDKPIVVSSNYTPKELIAHGVRPATVDRITEMTKHRFQLFGKSYRRKC